MDFELSERSARDRGCCATFLARERLAPFAAEVGMRNEHFPVDCAGARAAALGFAGIYVK